MTKTRQENYLKVNVYDNNRLTNDVEGDNIFKMLHVLPPRRHKLGITMLQCGERVAFDVQCAFMALRFLSRQWVEAYYSMGL